MSAQSQSVIRRIVAAFSALAVVLGLTATAVALAPAASATGSITRIELIGTQTEVVRENPAADTYIRGTVDAWMPTVKVRATFTGTATYSVDGGSDTPITSDRAFSVTLHDGVNAITITHDGNTYPIEVLHPWKLTGIEIFDADSPGSPALWSQRDAQFDPSKIRRKVTIPASVSSLQFKVYYDTPTDTDPSQYVTVSTGNPCDGTCESGEMTTSRGIALGDMVFTAMVGWNGRTNWNGYQASGWPITVTRPATASTDAISRIAFGNPAVNITKSESVPDLASGAIAADADSVDMRPTFRSGTVTWSVNDSTPVAVLSGAKATVPMEVGLNTLLVTHRATGGAETVYTYKFYRAFPITGVEIRDAGNSNTILYSKTGEQFTQLGYPNPTWNHYDQPELSLPAITVLNSVASVQVRMIYPDSPTADPYVTFIRGLRANYQCPGNNCESGEWSNSIPLTVGEARTVGPAVRILPSDTTTFSDWRIQITRETSTVALTGISIVSARNNTRANVGTQLWAYSPTGLAGVPTPTIRYQWQSKGNGDWEDITGATSSTYVVPQALKDRIFRVKAWASNGVAPDSTPIYSGETTTSRAMPALALRGVSVVPGNAKVTVSWAEPAYASGVTSYTASAVAGNVTKSCTTTELTCDITSLTNGTAYSVSVVANFGVDPDVTLGTPSTAVTVTPGIAVIPTMTSATIIGAAAVGERITADTTGLMSTPSPATLTYVWETAAAAGGPWTRLGINGNSTTFLGQAAEGRYVHVKVTATNTAGSVTRISSAVGPVTSGTGLEPDYVLDFKSSSSGWTPPTGLAFDASGSMYTNASGTIFKYAPGATATDLPIATWRFADNGDGFNYVRMTFDASGYIWIMGNDGRVYRLATDATAADTPQYKFTIDATGDFTVDSQGYGYASTAGFVGVYDLETGAKVRSIDMGGYGTATGLEILPDGNLFLTLRGYAGIYDAGPTGSNTPLRTFDLPTDPTPVDAEVADGRIWMTTCHDGCFLAVFDLKATGPSKPLYLSAVKSAEEYHQLALNPIDGQMYFLVRDGRVFGLDASTMGLGTPSASGAPGADAVLVTGSTYVNATLTASIVAPRGLPVPEVLLQWQRASSAQGPWTDIADATATSYVVQPEDLGKRLRMHVVLFSTLGEASVDSAATNAVTNPVYVPLVEASGADAGVYRPLQIAYLADGRIAVTNESSPAVSIVNSQTGVADSFIRLGTTITGVSAARGGGLWIVVDNTVQKWVEVSGTWTKTRELQGPTQGYFAGASRVVDDAAGYVYVQFPYNKEAVFAPGAASDAAPLRELQGWTEGLAIDIDGNLLVGGDGVIFIFAGGASTNTHAIGQMNTGQWVDNLEVDAAGRVWTYHRSGEIRAYDPRLRGTVTPSFRITPDNVNKLVGATTFTVSPTTNGRIAVDKRDSAAVNVYDWSTVVPAVPVETAPTLTAPTFTGNAKVSQELVATAGELGGYPTGTVQYQWQVSDTGTGGWTDIPGATSKSYLISGAYGYKYIRVKTWAVSHGGTGTATYPAATTAIEPGWVRTQVGVIQGSQDPLLQQTGLVNPWYLTKITSDRFVVSNRFNSGEFVSSFEVFPMTAANNDAPAQVIRFANQAEAWGSAQTASGTLLLSAWLGDSTDHIYEVAGNANGSPTPTRDLRPNCSYGSDIAVDSNGLIYVACYQTATVKVFAADADGEASPLRTITVNGNPSDIGFTPDGKLYVVYGQNVDYYEAGQAGSDTAVSHFETGYSIWSMTFDTTGRPLVAADNYTNIYTPNFASLTPLASFSNDEYTRMDSAQGVIYDAATGDMLVANAAGWRIQRYDVADLVAGDPPTPAQVQAPTVTVGNRKLIVSWTALTQDFTGYQVNVTGGSEPFQCTTTSATTCTFSYSGTPSYNIVNGVEYTVTVTAINRTVRGPVSPSRTATPSPQESDTPPSAPTNLVVDGLDGVITVRWTAPPGSPSKYQARARLGTTTLWCGKPVYVTALTCSIPNATSGKTYTVDVQATRVAYPTMVSTWSTTKDVLVKMSPTIGALTITGTPRATQSITGTVPTTGGTPAPTLTYQWQSSDQATTGFKDITDPASKIGSYALTNDDVGTYIRLKAIADNGTGTPVVKYSNIIGQILTKDGETKDALLRVLNVAASATGTKISVAWTRPVRGKPLAYTLTLKPKSGTTVTRTYNVTDASGDRMTMDVSGLAPGMVYTVTVQKEGAPTTVSAPATATTAAAPGPVKGVSVTASKAKVVVSWSAPSTTFTGTYTVTLSSSTRTYNQTVSTKSVTFMPVVSGKYTLKIVATSDVGVAGTTYTYATQIVL